MEARNRFALDWTDKEILRLLYISKPISGNLIAKYIHLSSPAVIARLKRLESLGILKRAAEQKVRKFKRKFYGKTRSIESPRCVLWQIDLAEPNK